MFGGWSSATDALSFIDRYPIDALFFTSAIAADLYANHYLTASYCIMPLVAWFVVRMRLVVQSVIAIDA
jgi:hypothetical protein